MSKWERFDDMMGRLIALAIIGFTCWVTAWGVIVVMRLIEKAVMS